MSHEQNPFYNHFPFHFLSGWPKPLWRVACNMAPARFGHHLCPSFVDRMFNRTVWRGHRGGLGDFPQMLQQYQCIRLSVDNENCSPLQHNGCHWLSVKTSQNNLRIFMVLLQLKDYMILCGLRKFSGLSALWNTDLTHGGSKKALKTAVYPNCRKANILEIQGF